MVLHSTAGFPNLGFQIFTCVFGLIGVSVVSFVFARRTATEDFFSRAGLKRLTWPRVCVILVFVVSWVFIVVASVLISGAGLALNMVTCSLGVYCCIVLYAATKILIYTFLAEKVWIVWEPRLPGNGTHKHPSRWRSPMYRYCMIGLSPFLVILAVMIISRIAEVRPDGVCVIGLKKFGSLSLLSFDLFVTLCLTLLFVWPLMKGDVLSPRLRRIASRTLAASVIALVSSVTNLTVLTILHGKEQGWVCLTSCGADVTVNAMAIFWVTGGTSAAPPAPPLQPSSAFSPQESKFDRDAIRLRPYPVPDTVTYSQIAEHWRDNPEVEQITRIDDPDPSNTVKIPPRYAVAYLEPRSPPSVLSRGVYAMHYSQADTVNVAPPSSSSSDNRPILGPSSKDSPVWISRLLTRKSKSNTTMATSCSPPEAGPSSGKKPPTLPLSKPSTDMGDDRVWAQTMMGSQGSVTGKGASKTFGRSTPFKARRRGKFKPEPVRQQQSMFSETSMIEFKPFSVLSEFDDAMEESDYRERDELPANRDPDTLQPIYDGVHDESPPSVKEDARTGTSPTKLSNSPLTVQS